MWHLQLNASCFLQDFSKKRSVSVLKEDFWDLGTFLSVPCIYDRLSCFSQFSRIFWVAASLQNKGRPCVWNPSKLVSLFEVSKYGVGRAGSKKQLWLCEWCWGWFDPRHSGNSWNQPTSIYSSLQQWIATSPLMFFFTLTFPCLVCFSHKVFQGIRAAWCFASFYQPVHEVLGRKDATRLLAGERQQERPAAAVEEMAG